MNDTPSPQRAAKCCDGLTYMTGDSKYCQTCGSEIRERAATVPTPGDTPRTDAEWDTGQDHESWLVIAVRMRDFARTLERELAASVPREEYERVKAALSEWKSGEVRLIDPAMLERVERTTTLYDENDALRAELAAVKAELGQSANAYLRLNNELAHARHELGCELADVRNARDRLAQELAESKARIAELTNGA